MSVGVFLFLGEGFTCLRNRFLVDTMSPIMQKSKRSKIRVIHVTINTIGFSFVIVGLIFIFLSKVVNGKSVLPSTLHSLCALITFGLLFLQVYVGNQKIADLDAKPHCNSRIRKWHGDAGLLLWDCLIVTAVTGCLSFFGTDSLGCLIVFSVVLSWFVGHLQWKQKGPDGSQVHLYHSASEENVAGNSNEGINSPTEMLMEDF